MATKRLTKAALIAAHDELDKEIGIEPPIDSELKLVEYEKELHETVMQLELTDVEVKGLSEKTQTVLTTLNEKHDKVEAPKEEEKPVEEETPKVEEKEEVKKEEKPVEEVEKKKSTVTKGEGVIKTIRKCVFDADKTKGISIKEILAVLVNKFPDRSSDSMRKTIQAQLPKRTSKETNKEVIKLENGNFTLK